MNITSSLDKEKIYTFVGVFNNDNTFTTIDNNIIDCMAYRHLRFEMGQNISVINIKYIPGYVNSWVIFQIVILDDKAV